MKLLYPLLGLTLLLASTVQAGSITTIQLMHRSAEEIIPIVKPMLGAGDGITGQGFILFLRSSPQTVVQVKEMIDALDIAAKMLQVSVFQGSKQDLEALSVSGNLQIETDDASVRIGNSKNKSAGEISYSGGNASGDLNATSTRLRRTNNPIHQLRVAEGTAGFIETGEQIPYFIGANRIAPGTAIGSTEYKDVTTGFYVLPRTHGDQVTLQVSPFKNSLSKTRSGNIETQQASTTITGRIGEWLQIGGVEEQIKHSQTGTVSYSSTKSKTRYSIWIKAELIR
jgi:hypothetical protein